MNREPLSLKVLAAYERDIGNGVVRIDHKSMDSLGVSAGDTIEVIGCKAGIDARCYPLLPSDEEQGITRIDPEIRKIIGVSVEDTVTIRNLSPVSAETFGTNEPADERPNATQEYTATPEDNNSITSEGADETIVRAASPKFILSGSCIDFDKERPKLMEFMTTLESATHSKSKCKCYSDGKKALGWDFFLLEVDQKFAEELRNIYPAIDKQEADTPEERLALWMNKQLNKMKLDFHLKLSDVPQEKVGGFRLNPEHFRDKTDLEDLR
jgi:hypothetical protein